MEWILFGVGVVVIAYLLSNFITKSTHKVARQKTQFFFERVKDNVDNYQISNDAKRHKEEFIKQFGEFFIQNNIKEQKNIREIQEKTLKGVDLIYSRIDNENTWLMSKTTNDIFKIIYEIESLLLDFAEQAIKDIEHNLDREIEIIMNDYHKNLPKQSFMDYEELYFDSERAEFITYKQKKIKELLPSSKHCIKDITKILRGDFDETKNIMSDILIKISNKCLSDNVAIQELLDDFMFIHLFKRENITNHINARDIETNFDEISAIGFIERRYYIGIYSYAKRCQANLLKCLLLAPSECSLNLYRGF